jgi:hypothetical protein
MQLDGDCCPTGDGTRLDCCDGVTPVPAAAPTVLPALRPGERYNTKVVVLVEQAQHSIASHSTA